MPGEPSREVREAILLVQAAPPGGAESACANGPTGQCLSSLQSQTRGSAQSGTRSDRLLMPTAYLEPQRVCWVLLINLKIQKFRILE